MDKKKGPVGYPEYQAAREQAARLDAKAERLENAIRDALLCDTVVQMSECLQVALDKEKE